MQEFPILRGVYTYLHLRAITHSVTVRLSDESLSSLTPVTGFQRVVPFCLGYYSHQSVKVNAIHNGVSDEPLPQFACMNILECSEVGGISQRFGLLAIQLLLPHQKIYDFDKI